jgi:hypothetical protein
VGLFGRPPGSPAEGIQLYLPADAALDYWEGEEPPRGEEGPAAR